MEQNSKINNVIIAIDGYSASGKTTLTKNLASYYKWPYLLTGNLYRLLAAKILANPATSLEQTKLLDFVSQIRPEDLESLDLNTNQISLYASELATKTIVRDILTKFQKEWVSQHAHCVIEGRDIGTVICPHATVKLFLEATPEVRAQRRYAELSSEGHNVTYEYILQSLQNRDAQDLTRKNAPLKKATDAMVIDSSDQTPANMFATAIKIIEKKIDKIRYAV